MYKGKKLSILGDSVSTYCGFSNDGSANATTAMNACFYRAPFPSERTYWMLVMKELGLELCVNNSYSGGNLCGRDNPCSGVRRAGELSRDNGIEPDLIIVFMGLNDLGRGVEVNIFSADYEKALTTIKGKYPQARVCCINLPDRDVFLKERALLFNKAIEDSVKNAGDRFFIADLFSSRLNNDFYYDKTVDGLHPDEDGMKIIAEVVLSAIRSNM